MTYILGVDVGTTYSAGAVWRDGRAEIASIGTHTAAIPSVVVLQPHGEVLVGEAAERRSTSEPTRTAREFKRRLGDPVPFLLGGEPQRAEALMGHVLRSVVERVSELEGGPPAAIVVSHPANYSEYKLGLLQEAVRLADVGPVQLVTEPGAAAVHYASLSRVEEGDVVAVYDFGGGTFDAAVVRKSNTPDEPFQLLGTPEGMERFGGIDLDQAVFAHVTEALGGLLADLDPTDPATLAAVARLRDECRSAKEALSTDTDVTIPVVLPNVQTEVRLTRAEFEDMIRPRLLETTDALARTVASAGLAMDDVSKVLLVGGSSRIPLVAEVVRSATGRPIAVDAHPKHAIALGAAASGAPGLASTVTPPAAPAPARVSEDASAGRSDPLAPLTAPRVGQRPSSKKRTPLVVAGVFAALLAIAAVVVLGGRSDRTEDAAPDSTPSTAGSEVPTSAPRPESTLPAAYPAGATDRFRDFCGEQGVPAAVCGCAIDGIRESNTYPEFVRLENAVYADPDAALPDDVAAVFERCAEDRS